MDDNQLLYVYHEDKWLRFSCKCVFKSIFTEQWEITGNNRTLVFENNRPKVKGKGAWEWKLLRGEIRNLKFRVNLVQALDNFIDGRPNKPGTTPFRRPPGRA